jgi:hypothetical protein
MKVNIIKKSFLIKINPTIAFRISKNVKFFGLFFYSKSQKPSLYCSLAGVLMMKRKVVSEISIA